MSPNQIMELVDEVLHRKTALICAQIDATRTRATSDFEIAHRAEEAYFDAYENLRTKLLGDTDGR